MSDSSKPLDLAAQRPDVARTAGRGGIAIAGAKLYFMASGLVGQIVLNHVLGLQIYGAFGRVQSMASIVYNPIIATDVQGVSRAISSSADEAKAATQQKVLVIHFLAVVPFAVALFALAGNIAALMGAPHLVNPIRIVAAVTFFYGMYTPLVGVVNGRKQFTVQAGLDTLAATLRTVALIGGAWYFVRRGAGVEGAFGAFAFSTVIMAGVSLPLAGLGRRGPGAPSTLEHLKFIAPLFGGQFALNLLLQIDMQLLGRFAADAATAIGESPTSADTLAGAYRNAQLFCFLPYQLLFSVTFVLFPMLATAQRDGDTEAVARYVQTGTRLALIITGLMTSVTAGIPHALLRLVFGAESASIAGESMRIMSLGLAGFAIFGVMITVLTSLKKERQSAIVTVVALGLVVGLCFLLVRGQPFDNGLLARTALATAAGIGFATALAVALVKRTASAVVAPLTALRVIGALVVTIAVAQVLPPPGKLMTLIYAPALVALFLGLLVATREIGAADWALVRRVLGRR